MATGLCFRTHSYNADLYRLLKERGSRANSCTLIVQIDAAQMRELSAHIRLQRLNVSRMTVAYIKTTSRVGR